MNAGVRACKWFVRDASVLPEGECGEERGIPGREGEYLGRKETAAAIAAQLCC